MLQIQIPNCYNQLKLIISLFSIRNSVEYRVLCSAILGLAGWAGVIFSLRQLMKLLLRYQGWLYEERGAGRQVSLPTRAWFLAMQPFFRFFQPELYSFQGALPTLPVPALSDTREKVRNCTKLV
jgi:carnitine O-palmitoyltransferase 1